MQTRYQLIAAGATAFVLTAGLAALIVVFVAEDGGKNSGSDGDRTTAAGAIDFCW